MAQLKPGDRIDCRVKEATIVSPYKEYDELITFEIVAVDKYGYYLFVPTYRSIHKSFKADKYQCKSLGIDKRFLDENVVYIRQNLVARISFILDGMRCTECNEFFPMAEPNQEDDTMVCWACRNYPSYR